MMNTVYCTQPYSQIFDWPSPSMILSFRWKVVSHSPVSLFTVLFRKVLLIGRSIWVFGELNAQKLRRINPCPHFFWQIDTFDKKITHFHNLLTLYCTRLVMVSGELWRWLVMNKMTIARWAKKSFIIWLILRCWGNSSILCQQNSDAL